MIYKHICSLGTNCHTASLLKRKGVKIESHPFDWILSCPETVIHCIEDNFNIFLNKKYYKITDEFTRGHIIYGLNMFHHHNPITVPHHYEYFIRCVDRFRNILNNINNKLFVITIVNGEHGVGNRITRSFKDEIIDFNNRLKNYTQIYILLVIIHYNNSSTNNYNIEVIDNIHFLEVSTLSKSTGTSFENENDNIYLDKVIYDNYGF